MSNLLLNSDNFGDRIYDRFPTKYKEDDVFNNYALKRYLQTMGEGGFKYNIEELNGLLDLKDKSTTPPEVLKLLAQELGFKYFNGIPEAYLRYLIPRIPIIWDKKGTLDVVDFAVSVVSGIKTSQRVVYDEHGNPTIIVSLEMDVAIDGSYLPDSEQMKRIITEFIPFSMDSILVYAYFFSESTILRGADNFYFDQVAEVKEDTIEMSTEDLDTYLCISYATISDGGTIESSENSYLLFTCSPTSTLNNAPLGIPSTWDKVSKNGNTYINYPSEYNTIL